MRRFKASAKALIILLVGILVASCNNSNNPTATTAKNISDPTPNGDKNLKEAGFVLNENTPAFALMIRKNGKTVLKDAQGCARFSEDKQSCVLQANKDTPMPVGSITKHFVVAAILMLEEEGRLSIEDDVNKYLSLPQQFKGVKIKNLIFHTSGMVQDYYYDEIARNTIHGVTTTVTNPSNAERILEVIKTFKLKKPDTVVYNYSNAGYFLLGKVVKKVSNQKLEVLLKEKIFQRLGMENTFNASELKSKKDYAFFYTAWPFYKSEQWLFELFPDYGADGGLLISINDYEKWIIAWEEGKIFQNKKTMEKFLSEGRMNNGKQILSFKDFPEFSLYGPKYGFGLIHSKLNFNETEYSMISHGGSLSLTGLLSNFALLQNKQKQESIWIVEINNANTLPTITDVMLQAQVQNYQ